MITFDPPIILDLLINPRRPRIVVPSGSSHEPIADTNRALQGFSKLPVYIHIDAALREIRAHLPPLSNSLLIYGPADFSAAARDTVEQHIERVQHLLKSDPTNYLQALADGVQLPALPPRIPREIDNWRARAVLDLAGLLEPVEAALGSLTGVEGVIARHAWESGAPLARHGATVVALAPALGLSDSQVDAMFIQADGLIV
jgi:hypothetical protein